MSKDGESYNSPTNVGAGSAWNPFGLLSQGIQDTVNIVNGWLTNLWQRQSNRDDYRRSRDDARYDATIAYQRQLNLLNNQRAYDDPSAQMARYVAAGLHPGMVAGGLSGPVPAQVQQSHGGTMNGSSAPAFGISQFGTAALQSRQMELYNRELDIRNRDLDMRSRLTDSQIDYYAKLGGLSEEQAKFVAQQALTEIEQRNKLKAEVDRLGQILEIGKSEIALKQLEARFSLETFDARVGSLISQSIIDGEHANAAKALYYATYCQMVASARNMNADAYLKELQGEVQELFGIQMGFAQLQSTRALADYYRSGSRSANAQAELFDVTRQLKERFGWMSETGVTGLVGIGLGLMTDLFMFNGQETTVNEYPNSRGGKTVKKTVKNGKAWRTGAKKGFKFLLRFFL